MFKIIFTDSYEKRAKKFIKQHPEIKNQYKKTLQLLTKNPHHPSLRFHKLQGKLAKLHSASINIAYRITLYFIVKRQTIIPIDIGKHDEVY